MRERWENTKDKFQEISEGIHSKIGIEFEPEVIFVRIDKGEYLK
jgi:hypothetical protein